MRSKSFSFIALLPVAASHAEDVDLERAVDSLITVEKAKRADEKRFREACISVLADDAVIFAPSAVNGKKFWREAYGQGPMDRLTIWSYGPRLKWFWIESAESMVPRR